MIPASNSVMANNLFLLGNYFENEEYLEISSQMMHTMQTQVVKWGSSYSNWCMLLLNYTTPFYEVAVAGPDANQFANALGAYYLPGKILIGSTGESELPLLENKLVKGETMIYVCVNKTCRIPVKKVEEAVRQMREE